MMFPGGRGQNTVSYQKQFDNGIQPVVISNRIVFLHPLEAGLTVQVAPVPLFF